MNTCNTTHVDIVSNFEKTALSSIVERVQLSSIKRITVARAKVQLVKVKSVYWSATNFHNITTVSFEWQLFSFYESNCFVVTLTTQHKNGCWSAEYRFKIDSIFCKILVLFLKIVSLFCKKIVIQIAAFVNITKKCFFSQYLKINWYLFTCIKVLKLQIFFKYY